MAAIPRAALWGGYSFLPAESSSFIGATEDAAMQFSNKILHSCNLHVAVDHFARVLGSVVEVLQVRLHLAQRAPYPQLVDMSVTQNRLSLFKALPADFHHLGNAFSGGRSYRKAAKCLNLIICVFCCEVYTLPGGSRRLIEPCPSSRAFESNNPWPPLPVPVRAAEINRNRMLSVNYYQTGI